MSKLVHWLTLSKNVEKKNNKVMLRRVETTNF